MPELPDPATLRPEADGESPLKKQKVDSEGDNVNKDKVDPILPKEYTVPEKLRLLRARKIVRENHGGVITQAAFNPKKENQNMLCTIGHDQVNIYDNEHCGTSLDLVSHFLNKESEHVSGKHVSCFAWINTEHDACIAFAGEEKVVQVISIAHNRVVKLLKGHTATVTAIASNPSKRALLATLSRDEGMVRLWNLNREVCVATLEVAANTVEFGPNGTSLFVGRNDGLITQYNIEVDGLLAHQDANGDSAASVSVTPQAIAPVSDASITYEPGHRTAVDCIRFTVDPEDDTTFKRMFTKSRDGAVIVWEQNNICMRYAFTPATTDSNTTFGVSHDGRYIVGGTEEGDVLIFDTFIDNGLDPVRNKPIATLQHRRCRQPVASAMFTHDLNSVLFTSHDAIWRWDFVDPNTPELLDYIAMESQAV